MHEKCITIYITNPIKNLAWGWQFYILILEITHNWTSAFEEKSFNKNYIIINNSYFQIIPIMEV